MCRPVPQYSGGVFISLRNLHNIIMCSVRRSQYCFYMQHLFTVHEYCSQLLWDPIRFILHYWYLIVLSSESFSCFTAHVFSNPALSALPILPTQRSVAVPTISRSAHMLCWLFSYSYQELGCCFQVRSCIFLRRLPCIFIPTLSSAEFSIPEFLSRVFHLFEFLPFRHAFSRFPFFVLAFAASPKIRHWRYPAITKRKLVTETRHGCSICT